MEELALLSTAALAVIAARPAKRRFTSKLRVIGRKRKNYVRFYPNPGFTLAGFHWCRARGRSKH